MNNFTFKKAYNNFRWENDSMILEFSNPSVEGYSDFVRLSDSNDIMYFIYTVKILKKIKSWNEKDKKTTKLELVGKTRTFDFPAIFQLQSMIKYQLGTSPVTDGQKISYDNGRIEYEKKLDTELLICEDLYELTKITDDKGKNEYYMLYCGTGTEGQDELSSVGMRLPNLSRSDIEVLFECISAFIQESIDTYNENVDYWKNIFEIKSGKIYEYKYDCRGVNKTRIETIYAIGDVLEVTTVFDNKKKTQYDLKLVAIKEDVLVFEDGQEISIKNIADLFNKVCDEKLHYNEDEIASDFVNILSDEEKEEFKKKDVKFLMYKYKDSIIDRTWMCMDEHNFHINYSGNRLKKVEPVVKKVISIIKSSL